MRISLYSFKLWSVVVALAWATSVIRLAVKRPPALEMLVVLQTTPTTYYLQCILFLMLAYWLMERFLHWSAGDFSRPQMIVRRRDLGGAAYEVLVALAFIPDGGTVPIFHFFVTLAMRYCAIAFHLGFANLTFVPTTRAQHQRLLFGQFLLLASIVSMLVFLLYSHGDVSHYLTLKACHHAFLSAFDILRHISYIVARTDLSDTNFLLLFGETGFQVLTLVTTLLFCFGARRRTGLPILLFRARSMYDRARLFCLHARDVLRCFCLHWLLIRYAEPPTQEDLAHDNTCIVCRGDMVAKDAVKLPCRHSIHRVCLDRWIWKQLRCPTCRSDLLYQYGEIERQDRLARGKDPNDA